MKVLGFAFMKLKASRSSGAYIHCVGDIKVAPCPGLGLFTKWSHVTAAMKWGLMVTSHDHWGQIIMKLCTSQSKKNISLLTKNIYVSRIQCPSGLDKYILNSGHFYHVKFTNFQFNSRKFVDTIRICETRMIQPEYLIYIW